MPWPGRLPRWYPLPRERAPPDRLFPLPGLGPSGAGRRRPSARRAPRYGRGARSLSPFRYPFGPFRARRLSQDHPKDVATAEKVFTHLYLGATFAGDPEGRDRSERHFRAALKFAPDADPSGCTPARRTGLVRKLAIRSPRRRPFLRPGPLGSSAPGGNRIRPFPVACDRNGRHRNRPHVRGRRSRPGPRPRPFRVPIAYRIATLIAIAIGHRAGRGAHRGFGRRVRGRIPGRAPAASPASEPLPAISAGKSRAWIWWAVGGGAALAAGTGALVLSESRSGTSPHRVEVDATLN